MGNDLSTANASDQGNQIEKQENSSSTSIASNPSAAPVNVEELFDFLQSLPNDKKLKRIFKLSRRLIRQKPELVQKVREAEASLKLHHRNVAISKIVGSSVGIASGISFIAGIALAPFTAGISLGLTIGGGIAGFAGGATFVGADIVENQLTKTELDNIQIELENFHKELVVLAKFDHQGLLAKKVTRFGEQLLELNSLSETGFIALLNQSLESITLAEDASTIKQLISKADDPKLKAFMERYIYPFCTSATKVELANVATTLKLMLNGEKRIYYFIELMVSFVLPLNEEVLPVEAITKGFVGSALDGVKVAAEVSQGATKIAPQFLKALGYTMAGAAIVIDVGFLIHTCVTMDDVPHAKTLRSLADQMEDMDIESVMNSF